MRAGGVTLLPGESEGRPALIGALGGISFQLVTDETENQLVEFNSFITLSELETPEGQQGLEALRRATNAAAPGAGDHLIVLIEGNTEGEGGSQTREFGGTSVEYFVLPSDDLAGFKISFE